VPVPKCRFSYKKIRGRLRADKFRTQVIECLTQWKHWTVFPENVYTDLHNIFSYGTATPSSDTAAASSGMGGSSSGASAPSGDSDARVCQSVKLFLQLFRLFFLPALPLVGRSLLILIRSVANLQYPCIEIENINFHISIAR
jgi:hypothetical protein